MKIVKFSLLVLTATVVAAAVYGQTTGKDTAKVVKHTHVGASHSHGSVTGIHSASRSSVSASPLTGPGLAGREAAYAPSDAFRKQAISLYETGDMSGAEAACLNALNAVPVIQGRPQPVPFVPELLGRIYLKDGQYQKAVQWLQGAKPHTSGGSLNLDLALAYVRLGDYNQAQECYSDQATLRYYPQGTSQDLPGTHSPGNLEASILLARGLDAYLEHRYDDALPDFQRANQLAPSNALIAYHCARILTDKGQYSAAASLYAIAAKTGHGEIAEEARRRSGPRAAIVTPKQ